MVNALKQKGFDLLTNVRINIDGHEHDQNDESNESDKGDKNDEDHEGDEGHERQRPR